MSANITIIEPTFADFPSALRDGALMAPIRRMYAIGNQNILKKRLPGFFCSIKCFDKVILRTYDLAQSLCSTGIPIIGEFHSSMGKECLNVLLCGAQPVVICPAHGIDRIRLPETWRNPLAENLLLVLSPFEAQYRRPTASLAEQRNRFTASLAESVFVSHAPLGVIRTGFVRRS